MKRAIYFLLLVLLNMGVCGRGITETMSQSSYWRDSKGQRGPLAVTCITTWQEINPFAIPKTIQVSNDMPDGTVLASWDYSEFVMINGISHRCESSGIHNADDEMYLELGPYYYGMRIVVHVPTVIQRGLKFIIYGQYTTDNIICPPSAIRCYGSPYDREYVIANTAYDLIPPFIEYPADSDHADPAFNIIINPLLQLSEAPSADYVATSASGHMQFRAELVKSGTISPSVSGSTLTFSGRNMFSISSSSSRVIGDVSSSNITLIIANCQLKTKDYTIPMGSWGVRPNSALPASGSETPINIALKCDDEVPHVRFRFEDTGSSPLGNHNVSLYTAEGGEKVDGMEIEMLYNGAHVDIDNTTLVDTGAHGTAGATGTDSTAKFTARYVQRSEITRNGNTYVGPVTGKVNMWVTYD